MKNCLVWNSTKNKAGYGLIGHKLAHRIMWEAFYEEKIPPGIDVCHHCDNPPCINPSHLFLGTAKDNTDDAWKKGRLSRGERHPGAKLTAQDVIKIRQISEPQRTIAKNYGVSQPLVHGIKNNKKWRHV